MTLIWLIVWLIMGAPRVAVANTEFIALMVCLAIDVLGIRRIS